PFASNSIGSSAVQQKMLENLGAERQRINGYPLVDPVEQRREVELRRQFQGREAEAADAKARKVFRVGAAREHVGHGTGVGVGGQDRRVHGVEQVTVETGLIGRQ